MRNYTKSQLKHAVQEHRQLTMRKVCKCEECNGRDYIDTPYTLRQAVSEVRYRMTNDLPLTGWKVCQDGLRLGVPL